MSIELFGYTANQAVDAAQGFLIVPLGMVALYFYGKYHFNSPEYPLDFRNNASPESAASARLITPAPPIFTTSRSRFNRYLRRYVLILEIVFLAIIFFPSLLTDMGRATDVQIAVPSAIDPDTVQYRAIWALFALTGLLSSFPGFRDVDRWLLSTLHRAAFIPDEARVLAASLYGAKFSPEPAILAAVRESLVTHHTVRVLDGELSGSLEQRLIDLLCLRKELEASMAGTRYLGFKIKLDRDLKEIERESQGLKSDLLAYLHDQEELVPDTETDIDGFIADNPRKPGVRELSRRRHDLQTRCDRLYETMCLLAALLVFATQSSQEDVDSALAKMGFTVSVPRIPVLDWDVVARVTGSMFTLMILFNAAWALFTYLIDLGAQGALVLDRTRIVLFALQFTVIYSLVMVVAIKLKRKWRSEDESDQNRPENLLIAVMAYAGSLCFLIPFSLSIRHELTVAPFLFAMNQGALGYFVGLYLDRAPRSSNISYTLAGWQGLVQLTISLIAFTLSPPLPNIQLTAAKIIYMDVFVATQSALSGFLIGTLFQYFYQLRPARLRERRIGTVPATMVTASAS